MHAVVSEIMSVVWIRDINWFGTDLMTGTLSQRRDWIEMLGHAVGLL